MMFDLVGQSGRDADDPSANPSRLVNVYAERTTDGVRVLKSVLGMAPHSHLDGVFIRAMGQVDGVTYAVCGGRLWRLSEGGAAADLGAVALGPASIAGNNGRVTVQAGGSYFVYDPVGGTIVQPAAGAFSGFGSVEYFDRYTVLTEADGIRFQWSALADPTSLPGLNFSSADGKDDKLVRAFAIGARLHLFKTQSVETWFNTGQAGAAALERVAGGVMDVGLLGRDLICRFPGGAFLIGSDNRAHMFDGTFKPISTPPVETAIKLRHPLACLSYSDEGHTFLCIVFRDCPAWCYDLATGEWHERAEGQALGPWSAAVSAQIGGRWAVGRTDGQVSMLERVNVDGTVPLVREVTSRTLQLDGQRHVVREFEVFPRTGYSPGKIALQISRDGGATWGLGKPKAIGAVGHYERRVIWRNLGQGRRLTARLRWTDPADISLSTQARVQL